MQRVFTVNYSGDSKYVISGSDDTNLRVWKAKADEKIGQKSAREEKSTKYVCRRGAKRRAVRIPAGGPWDPSITP